MPGESAGAGRRDPVSSGQAGERVPAVDRAVRILNLLSSEPKRAWGVSEISRQLELHKSTTHAILTTLCHHRFLVQDPSSRRYQPGPALYGLASALGRPPEVTALARPALEALLEQAGETVFLAVCEDGQLTLVDKAESGLDMSITSPLGRRLPHNAGALGKVFHAWMDPQELKELLGRRPLDRHTERTLTRQEDYLAELERVRREGVAFDDEEYLEGVRAAAVPVLDARQRVIAAICLVGPSSRLTWRRLAELGRQARRLAEEISSRLGAVPEGDGRGRGMA